MATFVRLVATPGASRAGESVVTRPDPHPATSGVSRFPSSPLGLLQVAPPSGGSADLHAPADAALRVVDAPPSLAGVPTLMEIAPLPFADSMRPVLAAL